MLTFGVASSVVILRLWIIILIANELILMENISFEQYCSSFL